MQSVQVCREARQLGSTRDPRQVGEGCQGSGVGNDFQHSKEKDMETDSIEDWKTRALAAERALAQIKDAKAVTTERLREMFEDYREAWSPGARDELLAKYA